jgi:hypothetical protein
VKLTTEQLEVLISVLTTVREILDVQGLDEFTDNPSLEGSEPVIHDLINKFETELLFG